MVRDGVPGPDVDEFANPEQVSAALAEAGPDTLLAVQHPHRTPLALSGGFDLAAALPTARTTLARLRATHYRRFDDVVAPYTVTGPDGTASGVLCLVDPAAVGADGFARVRHTEEVYADVVAERASVLSGLGCATSAALLVPMAGGDELTDAVRRATAEVCVPTVSTVDSGGREHRLWLLGPGPDRDAVLAAAAAHPLLVADGNHRVAAAAAAGLGGMLALVTGGPDLRIGSIHRVLRGTGLTPEAVADSWRAAGLTLHPTHPRVPDRPGRVVAVTRAGAVEIELPPPGAHEPRPRIDHSVVERLLLAEALGVDPAGPQVRALPAPQLPDPARLPDDADALLLLAPVPYSDVLAVHAQHRTMPRKATYFTPKPRSGLLLADLAP
ncbi:Protein of unknown function [Streptoalloteichus hindustanus]|uniref:DUF1015 domain-containing protein n=1 Tax=Streptoalloteichus hindustanus TaxID=2017 RepID=A0A1M5LGG0_STRHI|nr:Protein of unknown function [Streptoalloteichus hindustanus]